MRTVLALLWIVLSVATFSWMPRYQDAGPELLEPDAWEGAGEVAGGRVSVRGKGVHSQLVSVGCCEPLRLSASLNLGPNTRGRVFMLQVDDQRRWDLNWARLVEPGPDAVVLTPHTDSVRVHVQGREGTFEADAISLRRVEEGVLFQGATALILVGWIGLGLAAVQHLWTHGGGRRRHKVVTIGISALILFGVLLPSSFRTGPEAERLPDAVQASPAPAPPAAVPGPAPDLPTPAPQVDPAPPPEVEVFSLREVVGVFLEFGHFSLFFALFLAARLASGPKVHPVQLCVHLLVFAASTEAMQFWTVGRQPTLEDVIQDGLGVLAALGLTALWTRRRSS